MCRRFLFANVKCILQYIQGFIISFSIAILPEKFPLMINRYIFKSTICLGIIWCWALAFCGPIWLASAPIVHDMMENSFFAKELMQKRPALLKAIGSYPAIVIGGRIESMLVDRLSLDIHPAINTILVNTLLCLDNNVMIALPFDYDAASRKGVTFSLNQFALILGGHSKYNSETALGFLKLPCKLYGAIGQFLSTALPLSPEVFCSKDIMPYTIEVASHSAYVSPSLLVGMQKEDGPNSIHAVLTAFNLNKKLTKPKLIGAIEYTHSNSRYQFKTGVSYHNVYRHGTVHGSFLKRDYNLKLIFQQMFGRWWSVDGKWMEKAPGHMELNWDCHPSSLGLPTTLAVGYGWSSRFLSKKGVSSALFARASMMITQHAKLKIGMKLRVRDLVLKGFTTGLSIVF